MKYLLTLTKVYTKEIEADSEEEAYKKAQKVEMTEEDLLEENLEVEK